jgi:hypothetical protein
LPNEFWQGHQSDWYEVKAMLGTVDAAFLQVGENRSTFEEALGQPGDGPTKR